MGWSLFLDFSLVTGSFRCTGKTFTLDVTLTILWGKLNSLRAWLVRYADRIVQGDSLKFTISVRLLGLLILFLLVLLIRYGALLVGFANRSGCERTVFRPAAGASACFVL